jgi:hypothetical protein
VVANTNSYSASESADLGLDFSNSGSLLADNTALKARSGFEVLSLCFALLAKSNNKSLSGFDNLLFVKYKSLNENFFILDLKVMSVQELSELLNHYSHLVSRFVVNSEDLVF